MSFKYLIIGGNAFAARAFSDLLVRKKIYFINSSRSKNYNNLLSHDCSKFFKYIQIDINKKSSQTKIKKILKKFNIQCIVDFSSQSMVGESWLNPEDWIKTNIISKEKIYKIISNYKNILYVRISTPEVYGHNNNETNENTKHNPSTPYAITQSASDYFLKAYASQYKMKYLILRFANFYGPGQQLYRIIPASIMAILKKRKINIHGKGLSVRSFIYSDDFSAGILKAIQKYKKNAEFNFASKKYIKIIDLVKMICNKMRVDPKKSIQFSKDRMGKDKIYKLCCEKTKKLLQWECKISLDEGLNKTIDWYLKNTKILKKQPEKYIHRK